MQKEATVLGMADARAQAFAMPNTIAFAAT
jgi:hypothetical protein